jgi:hypothetical protein
MPLIGALRSAAERLDTPLCHGVIAEIEAVDPGAAGGLRQFVKATRYRALLAILDDIAEREIP